MELLFVLAAAAGLTYLIVRKLKLVAEDKTVKPPLNSGTSKSGELMQAVETKPKKTPARSRAGETGGWEEHDPFNSGRANDNVTRI
jgi:hypothetical protein